MYELSRLCSTKNCILPRTHGDCGRIVVVVVVVGIVVAVLGFNFIVCTNASKIMKGSMYKHGG